MYKVKAITSSKLGTSAYPDYDKWLHEIQKTKKIEIVSVFPYVNNSILVTYKEV
ncbi:hypothetical protein JMA_38880 (plasmid) [Jeotgalibacillus malaysiensis]|uniref:Uncharacterized protein n=1 Tax=Jeotgalibacillus malaysiensis TaxID=1508404 RepID=A0A0B5ASW9_9BACL|nr:hypothetical protein [Jeotgalibacillus malaysiensis]AJD93206.1 hypothetical protein JMA_38880 [Jeotgalibacillus malaysiensis]